MDNFFTQTMADLVFKKVPTQKGTDEHPFLADLFNDKITEVGHIQLLPLQNKLCITATTIQDEQKIYYITEPRLEFLKFVFENTNGKVKRAMRFYFQNSPDAKRQHREAKNDPN